MLHLGMQHTDFVTPSILLLGGVHGDEPVGRELLLQFSSHLCDHSSDDYVKGVCYSTICVWFELFHFSWSGFRVVCSFIGITLYIFMFTEITICIFTFIRITYYTLIHSSGLNVKHS